LLAKHIAGSTNISIKRGDSIFRVACKVNALGKIGLPPISAEEMEAANLIKIESKTYGFFQSFPAGVKLAWSKLMGYGKQVKAIANPETGGYKAIGGFKRIASIFPTPWNWQAFWSITAFLSVMLAFMNLLPIPALDGGHVVFTLFEMITGKKPSEKFLERAQIVGMVILLALMLYANGNDWFGWGSK
jgi:regulator of sigma E protease